MASETITRNDLQAILNEVLPSVAVDYIVEQGTSGNWTYRKWNSGKTEVWLHETSASLTIATAVGNMYQTASNITRTFPEAVGLSSVAHVSVSVTHSSYSVWSAIYGATTSNIAFRAMSAASRSSSSAYTIDAYVVGTWA